MKSLLKITALFLILTCISCSSKAQRPQEHSNYEYSGEKYAKVELSINKTASKDLDDIVRFDDKKLCEMIEKKLAVSGLIEEASSNKVKVEITDIRIRSSFNAIMWGVMAGDDHITGDVSLIGEDGRTICKFEIYASYALGGFAGMNETRMSWLFEKFSELTLKEIAGERMAKAN
ncbi:MAG: DUF4410 domain-containing protein [Desulfobacteraceae bacterium]|nr:DUF4410 domain-containing protein [Desulfobacteraceae bacterium]